jgi:hypothetical protein
LHILEWGLTDVTEYEGAIVYVEPIKTSRFDCAVCLVSIEAQCGLERRAAPIALALGGLTLMTVEMPTESVGIGEPAAAELASISLGHCLLLLMREGRNPPLPYC